MSGPAVVSAADIARLTGVGRSAVSNWRRRFADFPRPVAGAPTNPLFAMDQVERWCLERGKPFEADDVDRLWQRVQAEVEGVRLAEFIAHAGASLISPRGTALPEPPQEWSPLFDELARAAERAAEDGAGGASGVFSRLCERFRAARERASEVDPEVAEAMAELAGIERGSSVFDPACGTGVLLRAAAARGASVLWGQDREPAHAEITRARLVLMGGEVEVAAADSLRDDAFSDRRADAALCDPPFRDRHWGWEELADDDRWAYGTPARGESELAWVQHCLARVRPGGVAVVRVPASAAHRPSGRRVREALASSGALRTVAELPGAQSLVWVLDHPDEQAGRPSADVEFVRGLLTAEGAWSSFLDRAELLGAADLRPSSHVTPGTPESSYAKGRAALLAALHDLAKAPPELAPNDVPSAAASIAELVGDGVVEVQAAPLAAPADRGTVPLLTHKDLREGREPTGRTTEEPGRVVLRPGDVVASASGDAPPRVAGEAESGAAIGARLVILRTDPERVDPHYLAAALSSGPVHRFRGDPLKARIAVLPLDRQRAHVRALRRLADTERRLARVAELGARVVDAGRCGLSDRALAPAIPRAPEETPP
ncbi:N-6 DNA methylase [Nocardiopsis sp. RSe5-2]|uniref:N-6 DNA methylase n=1 Tax=Nocardiopsis endophytica TaxID=3018445 RepID=A0ABT4U143_9ACTN|nr:N-6 DNA methylase [Nocardiopsis endophytica]MDA2810660.1 N-6 DNA methylase [Nocardiopsis endophytica]